MNKIKETICPKCGNKNPTIRVHQGRGDEGLCCFDCGYYKIAIMNLDEKGLATQTYIEEEGVAYGSYFVDFFKPLKSQNILELVKEEAQIEYIKKELNKLTKKEEAVADKEYISIRVFKDGGFKEEIIWDAYKQIKNNTEDGETNEHKTDNN
jgi:hypothetical protein